MKIIEIQKSYNTLMGMKHKVLPAKMSFVLSRNLREMSKVMEDVNESVSELVRQYGDKKADGTVEVGEDGNIHVENMPEFLKELNDLYNADADIRLDMLSESDIEKCEEDGYDKLTLDEIGALDCMIW